MHPPIPDVKNAETFTRFMDSVWGMTSRPGTGGGITLAHTFGDDFYDKFQDANRTILNHFEAVFTRSQYIDGDTWRTYVFRDGSAVYVNKDGTGIRPLKRHRRAA